MPPLAVIGASALAGGAIGGAALTGAFGTALTTGGLLMGAGAGYGLSRTKMIREMGKGSKGLGMPAIPEMPKIPVTSVEEIEGFEKGWEEVLKKARGRRSTILTQPMLAQVPATTQRATLLGG